MKPLSDEKNNAFMNDPRRVTAKKELDDVLKLISAAIKAEGNAMYYLTVLPPLIKKLEIAFEELNVIETLIRWEQEEKEE